MKILFAPLASLFLFPVFAQAKTFDFTFKNQPMSKVIEKYAKESGQDIIFSPAFDPKISIMTESEVNVDKAFELLSAALAEMGQVLVRKNDTYVIMSARSAQRSSLDVVTKLPPIVPEKMVTFVYTLKHIKAEDANRNLRILQSKDGEMVPYPATNQLIFTDWVSNLYRIRDTLATIDQPQNSPKK